MLKFIPVRGRKRRRFPASNQHRRVEIYPREGTETNADNHNSHPFQLKFIPVRGRKREGETHRSGIRVEIYPREGTETTASRVPSRSACVEIYPREGTETSNIC